MSPEQFNQLVSLLSDIQDNQRRLVELQTQSLAQQQETAAATRMQLDRFQGFAGRAEALQAKSDQALALARRSLKRLIPLLLVALGCVLFLNR